MDDFWATKSEDVGLIVRAIISKVFNLCGHDPPTLQKDKQTDRQMDRQMTCDLKTTLSTIVHRMAKTVLSNLPLSIIQTVQCTEVWSSRDDIVYTPSPVDCQSPTVDYSRFHRADDHSDDSGDAD